jgi:hypothetical protein
MRCGAVQRDALPLEAVLQGSVWYGVARGSDVLFFPVLCCSARYCAVWYSAAKTSAAICFSVRRGAALCVMRCSVVWPGVLWCCAAWRGHVLFGAR